MTSGAPTASGWIGYHQPYDAETAPESTTQGLIDILDVIDIPVVVIGCAGAIASFNLAAANMLGLTALDIGRLPGETGRFAALPGLMDWVAKAVAGTSSRHDFHDGNRAFVLRVSPHGRSGSRISGAVLTFTNVTAFRASVEQAIHDREFTKAVLNTVPEPLLVLDAALRIQTANRAFHAMFEVSREEIQGVPLRESCNGGFALPALDRWLSGSLAGEDREPFGLDWSDASAARRSFLLTARRLSVAGTTGSNILLCFQDITRPKQIEQALERHAAEQAALRRLTDRLYRAETLAEMHDAALDAIAEALDSDRSSILLVDARNVMRFVAWRGLSERYRAAVEGHSPWAPDDPAPQPVCLPDIETADEPEALKRVVREEGIRALCFMPLIAHGRLIGKFMTYYRATHEFTGEEVALASTIARQLGFGIERKQADDARAMLAALVTSSHDAIISTDLEGVIGSWNAGAETMYGYTADEIVGKRFTLLIPSDRPEEEGTILGCIRRGVGLAHFETARRRKDGTLIEVSITVSPISDAKGRIVGASKIARDITDRKRQERHQNTLVNELNHRVKNTLASVQSIAAQTLRHSETTAKAQKQITSRLVALSKAHDVLTQRSWEGAPLRQLIEEAVAPHCVPEVERFDLDGPEVWVSPKKALAMTMALHELCTNAVKYGALSADKGRVRIAWSVRDAAGQLRLRLRWSEIGGPLVSPPSRHGFGSRLIERGLGLDLGGEVRLAFDPAGVVCVIDAPLTAEESRPQH
ncbi:MAG: PAS domain S-box protein [Alphaproteobacteria bacterium]|nr:PAS domain S-box protein [Alphaproteobacteria bacterium]MBV8412159.1 PAS domain S-box protein [Alphaproteobacteria bacterium]